MPSRRLFLFGSVSMLAAGCGEPARSQSNRPDRFANDPWRRVTDTEWRRRLSPAAYAVLREEDTERPNTSPLNQEKRRGTYVCAGCGLALFRSEWKYESGTGWPSFFRADMNNVRTKPDFSLLIPRTEYHCARCLGHQGHVFDDGPRPTGKRWCNNGVALRFVPA